MNENKPIDKFIGQLIDNRYLCKKHIGTGGMGIVFEAEDTRLDRVVVVKILKSLQTDEKTLKRFIREARVLSQLNHPNIVTIHDFGELDESAFLVMEKLIGEDLKHYLNRFGRLSTEDIVNFLKDIIEALKAAHQAKIIHRDLKPANLFRIVGENQKERIKILDFGLAISMTSDMKERITKTEEIVGTPHYMAPEQIMMNVDLTPLIDIYSLGVILHEMLTGQVPFTGTNTMEIFLGHLYKPIPPFTDTQSDAQRRILESIADRCLKKNPDDRFQSIDELKEAIERTQDNVAERLPELSTVSRDERAALYFKDPATLAGLETGFLPRETHRPIELFEDPRLPLEQSIAPLLTVFGVKLNQRVCSSQNFRIDNEESIIIINCDLETNVSLLETIKSVNKTEKMIVLVCGPDDDLEYITNSIALGFTDYLAYPYEPNEISTKLNRFLLKR